jgi:hypothetical protein
VSVTTYRSWLTTLSIFESERAVGATPEHLQSVTRSAAYPVFHRRRGHPGPVRSRSENAEGLMYMAGAIRPCLL